MLPDTRYAKSGDLRIAYQVVGRGPLDLVFVPGFVSNLDLSWEDPALAAFLHRLASFSRLILFDKRGTGLSDRLGKLPTLEERMDDVRAVMDAVGSKKAALFGISEGGAMAMLFAATYPDRTIALALYGAYVHHPSWVIPPEKLGAALEQIESLWGTGELVGLFAPSRANDDAFKRWWARFERLGGSPSVPLMITKMNSEIDIRHIIRSVRVPTLILHRCGDTRVNVNAGRYAAQHISGAKYVELPGEDHCLWVGDTDRIAEELEEFLTGTRSAVEIDRVLATVLFTDIVQSTRRAAELGDRAWRMRLEQHNAIVRQAIGQYRGREVKTMGDGFLVTFDGPARAVRCATTLTDRLGAVGLEVRSGVHTGEIELLKNEDIGGIAVHIASRISSLAEGGQVLVSNTVRDLVAGSGLRFDDRGMHSLKGLPENTHLYAVIREA